MSFSRVFLLVSTLLVMCLLALTVSAETCTVSLYGDSSCSTTNKPLFTRTIVDVVNFQCRPLDDKKSSFRFTHFGSGNQYNVSYGYYQSSTSCQGTPTFNFSPHESVSDCTATVLSVATDQIVIPVYTAATCSSSSSSTSQSEEEGEEEENKKGNKNSILALLLGQ